MKRALIFSLLFSAQLFASEPNPVPVPPGGLNLQTCYELAVIRSETLRIKDADIRVAQARYWQAVGTALPKVHLIATESVANKGSSGSSRR
jgi:hypothetical protein